MAPYLRSLRFLYKIFGFVMQAAFWFLIKRLCFISKKPDFQSILIRKLFLTLTVHCLPFSSFLKTLDSIRTLQFLFYRNGVALRGVCVHKNLQTSAKNVPWSGNRRVGWNFTWHHFGKLCYVHPKGATQRLAVLRMNWAYV